MTDTLTLRPSRPDDLPALNAVLWATYDSTWKPQLTADKHAQFCASGKTAQYVQSRGHLFWVAECDGVVAGFVDWVDDFIGALHVLPAWQGRGVGRALLADRKSTRLNSSHLVISYAVFCLKKKNSYLPMFPCKRLTPL